MMSDQKLSGVPAEEGPVQCNGLSTLQIYTAGIGTHVKSVKVTSICHRYYHVKV